MNKKLIFSTLSKIDFVQPYFDRIRIWSDRDISFLDRDQLTNYDVVNRNGTYTDAAHVYKEQGMKYNPSFDNYIDLFQPTTKNLNYLSSTLLKCPANFIINKLEVAYDFKFDNPEELAQIVNQHLVHPRKENTFFKNPDDTSTYYWGVHGVHDFFEVSYLCNSKIFKAPCFHLEWKLDSKNACVTNGIVTPFQLQKMNFVKFFKSNAIFYEQPRKYQIGRALAKRNNYGKRTNRWYEMFCDKTIDAEIKDIKNVPVQSLLSKIPTLNSVLKERKINKENTDFTETIQEMLMKKVIINN